MWTHISLNYGAYCIKITNSCYDTIITRCFTSSALPVSLAVTSNKSCVYNYAKFTVTVAENYLPVNIKVYDTTGNLLFSKNDSATVIYIDSIPGTPTGKFYKVVATDNCGNKDSVSLTSTISYLSHAAVVIAKCPGGSWSNGSGSIQATVSTNMGTLTVRIIKKDGIVLSPQLTPNSVSGSVYTFDDLGPATYILSYKTNDACNRYIYDTVVVNPYKFKLWCLLYKNY